MVKICMKIRKFSQNFPRSRKLILALGDRESLSLLKFIPGKVNTNKVVEDSRFLVEGLVHEIFIFIFTFTLKTSWLS